MKRLIVLLFILIILSCGEKSQVLTFTNMISFSPDPITEATVDTVSVTCSYTLSFQEIRGKPLEIVYARESVIASATTISEAVFQEESLSQLFTDLTILPGQEITLSRTTTFSNPAEGVVSITWLITGVDPDGNFENFIGDTTCE